MVPAICNFTTIKSPTDMENDFHTLCKTREGECSSRLLGTPTTAYIMMLGTYGIIVRDKHKLPLSWEGDRVQSIILRLRKVHSPQ